MRWSRLRSGCVIAPLLLGALAACGGGGGDDDAPAPWSGVTIDAPADGFATDAATITLRGRSFVPDGSACNGVVGAIAPGYTLRWRNAATGEGGFVHRMQLNCLLQVNLGWEVHDLALAPGPNTVTVTAAAADGARGEASVTVQRR